MDLILTLLVFLSITFLGPAIFYTLRKGDSVKDRIETYIQSTSVQEDDEDKPGKGHIDLGQLLPKISRIFASRSFTQKVQIDLLQADIPLKGEEYLTIWAGFALIVPILVWLMTFNSGMALLMFAIGAIGPKFYLSHCMEKRRHQLNQQLGDALVIMANALRAGFSFQQAMETVRRELPPPISVEFGWALREMNLGVGTEEALLNMGERAGSDDLDMVISAVLIQRQVGGNLAQIMDNISKTIRERARIKGEIKTLTAQGRTSGIIIGSLPIALLLLLLTINPTYMSVMLDSSIGYALLGGAFCSELIGAFLISRIVKIDY
ncbi:MAG: type II secretion system F family protein [Ignavibacteriales bacterium]